MKVYGVSAYDIERTVEAVSRRKYDGNVVIKSSENRSNGAGPRATFTIRVLNGAAGAPGAIGSPGRTGTGPHGGRRRISACWHAHWDVIEELLSRFPKARLVSGIQLHGRNVQYTATTFRDAALKTAHLNVGNWFEPVTMPQCCECDHTLYTNRAAAVDPSQTGQHMPGGNVTAPADQVGTQDYYDDDGYYPNAFSPNPGVPYLDGLPAAQPYGSATVDRTIGNIDKMLDDE